MLSNAHRIIIPAIAPVISAISRQYCLQNFVMVRLVDCFMSISLRLLIVRGVPASVHRHSDMRFPGRRRKLLFLLHRCHNIALCYGADEFRVWCVGVLYVT